MDLKPIRTEAEHAEALADIERLWDAPEGSQEPITSKFWSCW